MRRRTSVRHTVLKRPTVPVLTYLILLCIAVPYKKNTMSNVYNISGNCQVNIGSTAQDRGRQRQCYNCGKVGHLSRHCAKPRGGGGGGRGGGGSGRDGGRRWGGGGGGGGDDSGSRRGGGSGRGRGELISRPLSRFRSAASRPSSNEVSERRSRSRPTTPSQPSHAEVRRQRSRSRVAPPSQPSNVEIRERRSRSRRLDRSPLQRRVLSPPSGEGTQSRPHTAESEA